MIKITMENPGGVLDERIAEDETEAVRVLREMIDDAGGLHDGDVFRVVEVEEGA